MLDAVDVVQQFGIRQGAIGIVLDFKGRGMWIRSIWVGLIYHGSVVPIVAYLHDLVLISVAILNSKSQLFVFNRIN